MGSYGIMMATMTVMAGRMSRVVPVMIVIPVVAGTVIIVPGVMTRTMIVISPRTIIIVAGAVVLVSTGAIVIVPRTLAVVAGSLVVIWRARPLTGCAVVVISNGTGGSTGPGSLRLFGLFGTLRFLHVGIASAVGRRESQCSTKDHDCNRCQESFHKSIL